MELITAGLGLVLCLSLCANAFQFYLSKTNKKKRLPDMSAQDLLHDLMGNGRAILKVEVLDPANLLLRSPRA